MVSLPNGKVKDLKIWQEGDVVYIEHKVKGDMW
jgi:hypothetical protein